MEPSDLKSLLAQLQATQARPSGSNAKQAAKRPATALGQDEVSRRPEPQRARLSAHTDSSRLSQLQQSVRTSQELYSPAPTATIDELLRSLKPTYTNGTTAKPTASMQLQRTDSSQIDIYPGQPRQTSREYGASGFDTRDRSASTSDEYRPAYLQHRQHTPEHMHVAPPASSLSPVQNRSREPSQMTYTQALPMLATLGQDPTFLRNFAQMKADQDTFELQRADERSRINAQFGRELKSLGKPTPETVAELKAFDRRALEQWDEHLAKQQALMARWSVPCFSVTKDPTLLSRQRRVLAVLLPLLDDDVPDE
ncbi:uncharacterized protein L969DRAFT_44681 [Mixia osmundae IAM 14324]|uniref:Uncharacterized protein n=1 Tax=Mixia osmundae (strain CBS 9802 / IAM 14324 / JCM 22182 / KY 12970) TaxID=764103 RepID=G7DYE9_MIXOS|nr:uncharacterized protein L969DRAFT_44681 [Mixia osmundae IAM 14324]KEI41511.1 hypothetical protein L969DRAFT_44681 [Mixia osmundae IAM 14324]GAA95609.1 hypothetical protein E5Q_02265 [Mixia osmundae IAM 14324]